MEQPAASWLSDSLMENPNSIHRQWDLDSVHDQLTTTPNIWENDQVYSLPSESYSSCPPPFITSNTISCSSVEYSVHRVAEETSQNQCNVRKSSLAPTIISFGSPDSNGERSQLYESTVEVANAKEIGTLNCSSGAKRSYEAMAEKAAKKEANVSSKPIAQIQEHVIAERKRREKLSRNFIALSAIVPGLKKMDKASVLSDAVKYLKELQEKVTKFEDEAAKRRVDSPVLVKKCQLLATNIIHDDTSSTSDENSGTEDQNLPEIAVRISDKSVLIRIQCENHKGVLVKAISEIENLDLTVINTSVIPFASSSLDITVMAQMEEGLSMSVKDIAMELNSALRHAVHVKMVP